LRSLAPGWFCQPVGYYLRVGGVQTDELESVVDRLHALGYSVTDIRHEPTAAYAMAEGPDNLLIEIFQPDPTTLPVELRAYFGLE
jgi:hypothetical protein